MPRVLYLARTRPPVQPPFPLPPPRQEKPPATATRQQQHVDLDDPNSPSSPLPPDPSHGVLYHPSDILRPPSPVFVGVSDDEEGYSYGDESFGPYSRNDPAHPDMVLEHYNSQDEHLIKYQLVKPIISCIITLNGPYYHLNFTAKSTQENSKEEFFFAELRLDFDKDAWVPVSIVALEENERVGGFGDLIGKGVDPRHCFGCKDVVEHPVDGSLYEAGHYFVENCFFHKYIEVLPATQLVEAQD